MEEDIEKPNKGFAKKVAQDIIKQTKIKTFPILIKDIAKFIPDLYIDGKELEDEISGIQASYKGTFFIRYNANHPIKRNRFTVAHEIGHILLGHTSPCSRSGVESKNLNEIEANTFAAELLIPLPVLKNVAKKYGSVTNLAKAFWVSKEAMSWRVMETGVYKLLNSWN